MFEKKNYSCKQIQKAWKTYKTKKMLNDMKMMNDIKKYITEKLYCCVCLDTHVSFNRCVNGHGVCEFCYESLPETSCPICRDALSEISETTVCGIASRLKINTKCCTCKKLISINQIEKHRNWCEEYLFCCPEREVCTKQLKSSELYNHVLHHDKNIVKVTISETIFTNINSYENYMIICLEETKHVVVVSWSNNRADYGRGLIHVTFKCYYPSKTSPALNVTLSQHDMLKESEIPSEIFNIINMEPVLPSKENADHTANCVVTPLFNFKETHNYPTLIEVFKNKHDIQFLKQKFKRNIIYCKSQTYKRNACKTFFMHRESTAFISLKFSVTNIPISNIYN